MNSYIQQIMASIRRADAIFPRAKMIEVSVETPINFWSLVGSIKLIVKKEILNSGNILVGTMFESKKCEEDFRYSDENSFEIFPINEANLVSMLAFEEMNIAGPRLAKFEILEMPWTAFVTLPTYYDVWIDDYWAAWYERTDF